MPTNDAQSTNNEQEQRRMETIVAYDEAQAITDEQNARGAALTAATIAYHKYLNDRGRVMGDVEMDFLRTVLRSEVFMPADYIERRDERFDACMGVIGPRNPGRFRGRMLHGGTT